MCSIVGVLGKKIPALSLVEKARDSMFHRGPDDAGLYYNSQECIALGHRRLSIIDLSSAGHEPFVSNEGRYIVVFNGEIYNYLEIKKELKGLYNFRSQSDVEVLIAAYIQWGAGCLAKFNGMFAFAIWDKKEKELFLARDRFGVKPLYYAELANNFYFASEIKGILSFGAISRKLNKLGLLDYLNYRYSLDGETLFTGIKSLLPGHYAIVRKDKQVRILKYWELPVLVEKHDPGEMVAIHKTKELLMDSIKIRMRSDVPMGVYLSGGLDSSAIVALMSTVTDRPIKTFSMGFVEERFNELGYAKIVSEKFRTEHREFTVRGQDYFSNLPKVIRFKDLPLLSPNEVPWHILSNELKEHVTVIFSGSGADELFGGYGKILKSTYDLERFLNLENFSASDRDIFLHNLKKKYGNFDFKTPLDLFLNQYTYFKFWNNGIINVDFFDNVGGDFFHRNYFKKIFHKVEKINFLDQFLYIFQNLHLLGTLNHLDNVTMSASVEGREPFVDHRLVEYVSSLPTKYKIAWKSEQDEKKSRLLNSDQISEEYDIPKYLLKKVVSDYLPAEILNRKKMGFPVPLDKWFIEKYNKDVKDVLLSGNAKISAFCNRGVLEDFLSGGNWVNNKNYGLNVWMLLNLEIWLQEYGVSL